MSNQTKFTPGPWSVYSDDEVYSTVAKTPEGNPLVVVPDSDSGRDDYGQSMASRAQSRYNAHLIAAAPDMYQELCDIAADYHCGCGHPRCRIEETRRSIDALLAKARGEQ